MKRKIVFVIESLQLGGAEKSLVTLLQNLDYTQYDVDLLTFHKGGFFIDLLPNEVQHIVINYPVLSLKDRILYKAKRTLDKGKHHHAQLFWPIVKKYFKTESKVYDIAIAYNQGFSTYYVAQFVQAKVKYAWLNIDYQKAGYQIEFDYPFYRNFDRIITVSPEADAGFHHALDEFGMHLDTLIIKDITDADVVKKQADQKMENEFLKKGITLVSVGRLAEQKGIHLAIEACKILLEKHEVYWYVIGEGGLRSSLQKQIEENNLTNNFFLWGAYPNPYPYMKACDIYVQTSLFEGLGLTVIEASYLNKPIVSTDFPTVYGIIKNEETGLIAEMNAPSIAKNVERLINNKELREKLRVNLEKLENKDKNVTLSKIKQLLN